MFFYLILISLNLYMLYVFNRKQIVYHVICLKPQNCAHSTFECKIKEKRSCKGAGKTTKCKENKINENIAHLNE